MITVRILSLHPAEAASLPTGTQTKTHRFSHFPLRCQLCNNDEITEKIHHLIQKIVGYHFSRQVHIKSHIIFNNNQLYTLSTKLSTPPFPLQHKVLHTFHTFIHTPQMKFYSTENSHFSLHKYETIRIMPSRKRTGQVMAQGRKFFLFLSQKPLDKQPKGW